jgi:hypothetical protein
MAYANAPFSKIFEESPSFVIFPLHELISFIVNTGSTQGYHQNVYKFRKTDREVWE